MHMTHMTCIHTCYAHMHTYSHFLMPGLVCCHIHGDQVENAGANYDKPYLNWLIGDFIPTSQQFATNQTYASNAASLIVVCTWKCCMKLWINWNNEWLVSMMLCVPFASWTYSFNTEYVSVVSYSVCIFTWITGLGYHRSLHFLAHLELHIIPYYSSVL